MRPPISRQHDTTSLPELYGETCAAFMAVLWACGKRYGPLFIQLGTVWHRFYLDAGLLFWKEGFGPDAEDDLLEEGGQYLEEGEQLVDLGKLLEIEGSKIEQIEMNDCQLTLRFDHGARLVFREEVMDAGAEIVEFVFG